LSRKYGETVCTAGVREDGSWVRLYPVPFRRLDEAEQYKKYDWVECDLARSQSDPRPETHRLVDVRQLVPVAHMGTADSWRERRDLLLGRARVYTNLATLIADAKANVASLAVFKPTIIKDFIWEEEDREWDPTKLTEMRNRASQSELFAEEAGREVRQKYLDDFSRRDLHFFLGTTQEFHFRAPNPWVIVGVLPIPHCRQPDLF
jgi:hypothetical protein